MRTKTTTTRKENVSDGFEICSPNTIVQPFDDYDFNNFLAISKVVKEHWYFVLSWFQGKDIYRDAANYHLTRHGRGYSVFAVFADDALLYGIVASDVDCDLL